MEKTQRVRDLLTRCVEGFGGRQTEISEIPVLTPVMESDSKRQEEARL